MAVGKKGKDFLFHYYRFQIVPSTTAIQTTADEYQISSYSDLVIKRNRIFKDVVNSRSVLLEGRKADYVYKVLSVEPNYYLLRIARKKDISIDKEDFSEETIVSYPNVLVLIDNRSTSQEIIIQQNYKAFDNTAVVANILERNFNRYLKRYQLTFYLKPITEENEFWKLTERYQDRITQISFDILNPDIANLSGNLSESLKVLQRVTNSHRTRVELNANKNSTLENLNSNNNELGGLVEYVNMGGGEVTVKVKGIRKKIHTNKHISSEIIDEISIRGQNAVQIKNLLKEIII